MVSAYSLYLVLALLFSELLVVEKFKFIVEIPKYDGVTITKLSGIRVSMEEKYKHGLSRTNVPPMFSGFFYKAICQGETG